MHLWLVLVLNHPCVNYSLTEQFLTWLYDVNHRKMNVFYSGGHECYDEL